MFRATLCVVITGAVLLTHLGAWSGPASTFLLGQPSGGASGRPLALTGLTVIDATGDPPRPNMTVVISGERVVDIRESKAALAGWGDADVEDCSGKFVIPGLWDMHVHLTDVTDLACPVFVANGITGVRDMGGDLASIDWMRCRIDRGTLVGPHIFRCGPFVDGLKPGLPNRLVISTAAEGVEAVHLLKRLGVDFIKVHNWAPPEAYLALLAEAKKEGMTVAGHVPVGVKAATASEAGQRIIEHMTVLTEGAVTQLRRAGKTWEQAYAAAEAELPDLFETLAHHGTWVDPTLVACGAPRRGGPADQPDYRAKYVAASVKRHWDQFFPIKPEPPERTAGRAAQFDKFLHWVGQMKRAQVRLLAGTDTGVSGVYPGFTLHEELGWLVKGGLSEMEALQAATRNAAVVLGQSKSLGTVEKGKYADLVILDANPLEKIEHTRKIHAVVLRGRLLRRGALDALLAEVEAVSAKR